MTGATNMHLLNSWATNKSLREEHCGWKAVLEKDPVKPEPHWVIGPSATGSVNSLKCLCCPLVEILEDHLTKCHQGLCWNNPSVNKRCSKTENQLHIFFACSEKASLCLHLQQYSRRFHAGLWIDSEVSVAKITELCCCQKKTVNNTQKSHTAALSDILLHYNN